MIWILVMLSYGWNVERLEVGQYETKVLCEEAKTQATKEVGTRQWVCVQGKQK